MNAFEMASLTNWSMENGPPSRRSTGEGRAAPETNSSPPTTGGAGQIPGYGAHRQRQEARALMGSIAERRGKNIPALILIRGDVPSPLSRRQRWVPGCRLCRYLCRSQSSAVSQ
ncbi:hypothetical protein N7447_010772 [Penicillium robsamsonii]|uniref:uncharacterized protein n=1 Tax=Penicillium robsamsonii TaxID=1792511 RepID=UPI00254830B3|nr:uncharacterized protein N7447_010772 [Penicillium robsamsonii]KAJ5811256.1 hypothetical protein N7447_010772 [Penicillium robsamsonii]